MIYMADGFFQDLRRGNASNKIFQILSNPQYDGYKRRLLSMVYKFLDEKQGCGAVCADTADTVMKSKIAPNQQSADESHKSIT